MKPLRVCVSRLADGRELPLRVLELTVTAALFSPARAARLTAAVDAHPGELGTVRIEQEGHGLFTGSIDRQEFQLGERGRLLTLEARSRGARLLDNEARPCTLENVRISTLFERCIAPYGFLLEVPAYSGGLGLYTIHKGTTEWEAFAAFCRNVYGTAPFVRGDSVVVGRPHSPAPLTIGTAGLPYTQLAHIFEPYNMLSKVVLRDRDGNYSAAVQNSAAKYYAIQRVRYSIPPSEFTDSPGLDANQRIQRGMLHSELLTVTLPGIVQVQPGQAVRIADSVLHREGLFAEEVVWRQGPDGLLTTLALRDSAYYG